MTKEQFIWWFVIFNWEKLGDRAAPEAVKAWDSTAAYLKGRKG